MGVYQFTLELPSLVSLHTDMPGHAQACHNDTGYIKGFWKVPSCQLFPHALTIYVMFVQCRTLKEEEIEDHLTAIAERD